MNSIFKHYFFKRFIVLHLLTIIGLCYYWDPIWFLCSVVSTFFFSLIGFEIGLHRYYAHRSFTCKPITEIFFLICNLLSGNTRPRDFAFMHRVHHKESDNEYDPHIAGTNVWAIWAQFYNKPREHKYNFDLINDLKDNKFCNFIDAWGHYIYIAILLVSTIISVKFTLYFFIIGALLTAHTCSTLVVLCHKYGYQTYDNGDHSTNNPWCWYMWGGQWHNNHHHTPWRYTTKEQWWEFDFSGWIIKHFLATSVKE